MSSVENLPSELEKLRLDMLDDKIKLSVIREFVSQFIELMKQEYGEYWNPLRVNEIQFLQLKNWGKQIVKQSVIVHNQFILHRKS